MSPDLMCYDQPFTCLISELLVGLRESIVPKCASIALNSSKCEKLISVYKNSYGFRNEMYLSIPIIDKLVIQKHKNAIDKIIISFLHILMCNFVGISCFSLL